MKKTMLLLFVMLAGCAMTPEQEARSRSIALAFGAGYLGATGYYQQQEPDYLTATCTQVGMTVTCTRF